MTLEDELQANASYIVELTDNVLPGQRITAESLIKDMKGVEAGSVYLLDKGSAKKIMQADFPILVESGVDNPFRDLIIFKIGDISQSYLNQIQEDILQIDGVEALYAGKEMYQGLESSIKSFRWALLGLSVFLLLVAGLIAVYILNSMMMRNAEKVRVLHLAGVQQRDIMSPYMAHAFKTGLLCGILAMVLLIINIFFINRTMLNGVEVSYLHMSIASIFVLLTGTIIFVLVSYFSTRSFIHKSKSLTL